MDALMEILSKPTMADLLPELAALAAPICVAVLVGLLAGWAWRPRWALDAVSAAKAASFARDVGVDGAANELTAAAAADVSDGLAVTAEDFDHLRQLVQVRDGGPEWQPMMEKSMAGYSYRAWKREPEKGPPEYRSSTIFDAAAPDVVRNFFWDDEFRSKNRWDDMLLQHDTLEECKKTGTMVVRWVRKFPFFCSDREYIIGRRIWEVDGTYYCVTKGVPRPSAPRHNKPRRVDLYYSSWCIRPVESRSGDGQMTACEVLLFHHEDMGIPWEIAKRLLCTAFQIGGGISRVVADVGLAADVMADMRLVVDVDGVQKYVRRWQDVASLLHSRGWKMMVQAAAMCRA